MQSKKRVWKRDFINFLELLFEPGTLGYGVLLVLERGNLISKTVDDDDGNHHLQILHLEEPISKTLQSFTKSVKGLPYTHNSQSMLDLTENKTCI
jgi:hypothetical protein